jgi:hypothetical protein
MSSELYAGVADDDMRRHLEEMSGGGRSAVYSLAYERAARAGKSDAEAKQLAEEAERRNVFGFDYKTDKNGQPTQQGIGSENNLSINHFAALKKAEVAGREAPGTWEKAVKELWRKDAKKAAQLGLPQHRA